MTPGSGIRLGGNREKKGRENKWEEKREQKKKELSQNQLHTRTETKCKHTRHKRCFWPRGITLFFPLFFFFCA